MSCPHCTGRTRGAYRLDDRCDEHRDEPVIPGRIGNCQQCGATFACDYYVYYSGRYTPIRYCSDECRQHAAVARRRDSQARRVLPTVRPCDHCHAEFTALRRDARFCSGRCRVAAHRAAAITADGRGAAPCA